MAYTPQGRLKDFLRQLPKTETHLHLEGALPWHLIHELYPERFAEPPESWKDGYKFSDFAHFEHELLEMAGAWFTSPERYHEAACLVFEGLYKQENVRYLETSFASGVIEFFSLDCKAVLDAIVAAVPDGMVVRVFMGIHHDGYTEKSAPFIEDCLDWEALAGVDLHGTETTPLEPWTRDLWQRARDAGKCTKAHAGEFAGADFVARVIDELGVRRIQHGVRSVEDPQVLQKLVDVQASLDVCPISNIKLDVIEDMAQHPIRQLVDAGIPCTISTDDPISFGNTLTMEYTALHSDLGFTYNELANLARNGFRNALVDDNQFLPVLAEIDDLLKGFQEGEV